LNAKPVKRARSRAIPSEPLTLERLRESYAERRDAIRERLREFEAAGREGDDSRFFEELAFCIFAAGTSARHGMRCIERAGALLFDGDREQLREALRGQRFYNLRSGFLHQTREHLRADCSLKLKRRLAAFPSPDARRDFLALDPNVRGIGMKEASHFLRNVGYRGYAILDKHILKGLAELGVLETPAPPGNPKRYREIEARLHEFSESVGIDADEMDLLLWSERTGEILK
jgi:N-glycosylase/DNA lyase